MDNLYIGIDTSCYTTSVACIQGESIVSDERTVLSVPFGEKGLRQSEILFRHNRNFPDLLRRLFERIDPERIAGVGVSQTPTEDPDSYMPAFLAGISVAEAIAGSRHVPLFRGTHQQMHIRAALLGNPELMQEERFLAFHVSGGTTDLLEVGMHDGCLAGIRRIGMSTDLHAGQLVDRIGVKLGCTFPCGPALEKIAVQAEEKLLKVPSSVRGTDCSLSGAESMLQRLSEKEKGSEIAYAVYDCLSRTFSKMLLSAREQTSCEKVLMAGGVSSSRILKDMMRERLDGRISVYSGRPELSTDNAVGTALLARDALCQKQ